MDEKSLITLEFDKVLAILAGYTSFSAGEELARQLRPETALEEARLRQQETTEADDLLTVHNSVTIGGAHDVRQAADNAQRGFVLPAQELLNIQATIAAGRNLRRQLLRMAEDYPRLAEIAELIEQCPGLVSAISSTIDERGQVLDSASEKLAAVRRQQHVVHDRIQEKLQRLLNSSRSQFLQESIITRRSGRFVIPLRADARGRIKGIVHDHSGSGATLWLEPMNTVELNNEYRGLHLQEQAEIERVLRALSEEVAAYGEPIKRIVERMAELDLIFARARYGQVTNAVAPVFVAWKPRPSSRHPGCTIWIKGARHPLLDREIVVPTDLTLDEETFILLITGPNTGGKTVSLKTAGLAVLMAQAGLHLPAVAARLTVFENIFADIGDEQSIEQSLSTFSGHMTNISRILDQADERSLVLLDELGAGTDPAEGAALAQAIVSYLRDRGATTFVATHYPELKLYASNTDGATNASLLFDVESLSPTYEMAIGLPGRSNAFAIARRLGVEETILGEAMQLVGSGSTRAESMLDTIYSLREKIEAEEAQTRLALRDASAARDELVKRLEAIEGERQEILAQAQQQGQEELEALRVEIRRLRAELRGAASLTALKKVSKEVTVVEETLAQPVGASAATLVGDGHFRRPQLQEGDVVLVRSLGSQGTVLSLSKYEAVVALGRVHMRAPLEDLEFKERPADDEQADTTEFIPAGPSPGMELNLRGKRVEDGLADLERYLDAAFLAHLPWVRIIHGKGTGRLRQAVRDALRSNSHILSWEEGRDGEGGAGVTVARLVKQE